jgi:diguanylate cyclase (GGDEF)-like protein
MKLSRANSLAANITLVVLLASGVSLGVFAAAMLLFDRSSAIADSDARLATLADIVGQNSMAALDFEDREAARKVLQALRREPQIVSACLYGVSGHLFSSYYREQPATPCPPTTVTGSDALRTLRSVTRPIARVSDTVGTIYLAADMHSLESRRNKMVYLLLVMSVLSLGAGGFTGSIMQKRISKPIARLARGMHDVTSGATFDVRADLKGSKEIVELAQEFNSMLVELERRDRLAKQAELRLHHQACTDSLTGLPNRRLFSECLTRAIAQARRDQGILGLLYIDLDGFKLVNDSLGHSIGDTLLSDVATRFKQHVRKADVLSRVGGDEFTVILSSLHEAADAGHVAESLLACLAKPFRIEGHDITVGASVGISTLDDPNTDSNVDLLQQADSAMYAAKRNGRNRAVFFTDDLGLMARERLMIENELRGAIERGEIYVQYQPEFNAVTGDIVRFEALARWLHPTLGEIEPERFIPVAEDTGLIFAIGNFVMETACTEAIKWQRRGCRPIQVAVNMSAIQFNSNSILDEIAGTLQRTGIDPRLLQIELTESVMVGSIQRSSEMMHNMRELGLSIAIDDFGTGFSCLGYLPNLPIDVIKIDRSFTSKLSEGSETVKMVRSMIDLAHSMDMRVIVEGVEEHSQLCLIREMGADEVQGFLLGHPGPEPSARSNFQKNGSSKADDQICFDTWTWLLAERS